MRCAARADPDAALVPECPLLEPEKVRLWRNPVPEDSDQRQKRALSAPFGREIRFDELAERHLA